MKTWKIGLIEGQPHVLIVVTLLVLFVVGVAWTAVERTWGDTTNKVVAQARIEALTKRTAEIGARQTALAVQYKDLLSERAKWRKLRDMAVVALEKVDKQLEGYVLETERIGVESATSTEEVSWLKERLKEVDQGATDKVALDQTTWLQMLADGEIKLPTREE